MLTYRQATNNDITALLAIEQTCFISDKISENPNDRQSKIFYYKSDSESWYLEDINFERKKIFDNAGNYNLNGVIRPLTMISYKGKLFLSGHYGSIKS